MPIKKIQAGYCFRTFSLQERVLMVGCHLLDGLPRHSPVPVWRDYAGLLVVGGTGSYEDEDGTVQRLTPGCFVQHLPGRRHTIRRDSPRVWQEWSVFLSSGLYASLRDLGMIQPERPVWTLRHPALMARRYAQLQEALRQAEATGLAEVLVRVQQLLLDLQQDATECGVGDPVAQTASLLSGDLNCRFRLPEIAAASGISYPHLRRLFGQRMGCSMVEYRTRCRLERAGVLVAMGGRSIGAVARELGFYDQFTFSRQFKAYYGQSPLRFRGSEGNESSR